MPDRVAMPQPHYKGEVGPARWYTIVDLETLPVRRDRTHRPVGTWLSLVEHSLGVRGVGSSNLPVPTKFQPSAFSQSKVPRKTRLGFRLLGFNCAPLTQRARLRLVITQKCGMHDAKVESASRLRGPVQFWQRYPNGGGTFSAWYALPNVSARNNLSSTRCRRLIIPGVSSL